MNPLYDNAVDSLKVGMQFFLDIKTDSAKKHAILAIFHSIELFLKEYLYRVNPILIYKNIDSKITDDSLTVGINDIICRLDNLKVGLPKDEQDIIKKIQKRRNRIEHHTYAKNDTDYYIIGESLKFVLYFVSHQLNETLQRVISHDMLNEIEKAIYNYQELNAIAHKRLSHFLRKVFPEWNPQVSDIPSGFPGTFECPICNNSFLVMNFIAKPFCFYCNKQIDTKASDNCSVYS